MKFITLKQNLFSWVIEKEFLNWIKAEILSGWQSGTDGGEEKEDIDKEQLTSESKSKKYDHNTLIIFSIIGSVELLFKN